MYDLGGRALRVHQIIHIYSIYYICKNILSIVYTYINILFLSGFTQKLSFWVKTQKIDINISIY